MHEFILYSLSFLCKNRVCAVFCVLSLSALSALRKTVHVCAIMIWGCDLAPCSLSTATIKQYSKRNGRFRCQWPRNALTSARYALSTTPTTLETTTNPPPSPRHWRRELTAEYPILLHENDILLRKTKIKACSVCSLDPKISFKLLS